jgi:hypothetical protein
MRRQATVKRARLGSLGSQKASHFTTSTRASAPAGPQTGPQQRAPALRQSSAPGAQPSCPRANQARTPPARPTSTEGSAQAAESATSVPDGRRPCRRMAGSGTEAVALPIRGTGRGRRDPARAPGPGACRPAADRLAPGSSPRRWPAGENVWSGGSLDLQHEHGPLARAAALPPRPGAPGREAAPGSHGCPCPTSPPSASGLRLIGMAYLHANMERLERSVSAP